MRRLKIGKIIVWAAIVVVALPLALFLIAVVSIAYFDRTNGSIVSDGETREYLLHVPASYDAANPTPLVISLHAGATWPAHQKNLSRWNRLADEHGFIVVYPSGSDMPKIWHVFTLESGPERDVRFISDLIDALQSEYNIDPARIYANGMSNGGGMAFALSCTLSDRIAAVGMVAAAQSLPAGWCKDTRPVPAIAFHGTADPIVPYGGGLLGDPLNPVKPMFAAVRDWLARWAQRNRCATEPVESTVAPDVARTEYPDCADNASVILYTVEGGGHAWPGGKPLPEWWVGPTSNSVDATRLMWDFFREHRLRSAQSEGRETRG